MICFQDKTFCSQWCANTKCDRRWTDLLRIEARQWWGDEQPPIAFSDHKGTSLCPGFVPPYSNE